MVFPDEPTERAMHVMPPAVDESPVESNSVIIREYTKPVRTWNRVRSRNSPFAGNTSAY